MNKKLSDYSTLIFDCDGVVLNSNKVKTEAFYQAALPYGEAAAKQLVDFHTVNGGISRYQKMQYFLNGIVPLFSEITDGPSEDELLGAYAENVRSGLLSCEVSNCIEVLRRQTSGARWLIVSGGDQIELQEIFRLRNLSSLFDAGIYGSPDNKDIILARELENETIKSPALFLGDSKYDYEAAKRAGIDFLFLYGWSDFLGWQRFCIDNSINYIKNLECLAFS